MDSLTLRKQIYDLGVAVLPAGYAASVEWTILVQELAVHAFCFKWRDGFAPACDAEG